MPDWSIFALFVAMLPSITGLTGLVGLTRYALTAYKLYPFAPTGCGFRFFEILGSERHTVPGGSQTP
ncbi:hypothetical protein TWF506_005816 [Arthrobotrys conoides]|uniref:Uncharacterized protein n=1 Tax=Arthrobotrys conoides TaxID=74498 RepID=A0AAN8NJY8_9PEZI